jgi:hypothetical protein
LGFSVRHYDSYFLRQNQNLSRILVETSSTLGKEEVPQKILQNRNFLPWLALGTSATISLPIECWNAQIVPDNTLVREGSIVTPITPQIELIQGGATRGVNLFHSFQEFNIGEGKAAFFDNPAG